MSPSSPPASSYCGEFFKGTWPHPGLLTLTLNRPPVNAISTPVWKEMTEAFNKARLDPECLAIVLRSDGKYFTAGLDLLEEGLATRGADPARSAFLLRQQILDVQGSVNAIQDCNKPVIAAVQGLCYGFGVAIISACDIRLVSPSCRFSIKEVDIGIAADVGSLQRLPRVTGNESLLRELALTARDFGVEEAVEVGLVAKGQVIKGGKDEVWKTAEDIGKLIASKSPIAVQSTKHLLNFSQDHTVREGLEYTAVWNSSALQAEDVSVAMSTVMSKSKPEFKKMGKL